ncbi:hypothetical protein F2Q68_00030385 [Brassica cretica]|uniref:Uncharacterized protein n=1 Tax=Brassica cretica TaxID=69181 RepID=A0A8S9GHT9_BRACR|nr:hypothetical protein F2Q68_00030385 [Brassica cretica]
MEEELRDKKAQKDYYNMLDFVANAQQGIPKLCPCGSITKETVDEEDTYDYLPGKRYFICKDFENDGLHFRQPWVMAIQEEVERLKEWYHEQAKLLRECHALKDQVRMLQDQTRLRAISFTLLVLKTGYDDILISSICVSSILAFIYFALALDEVDRRLYAVLDEAVDEYIEDTLNNIVENRTVKPRKRAYVERNREEDHNCL